MRHYWEGGSCTIAGGDDVSKLQFFCVRWTPVAGQHQFSERASDGASVACISLNKPRFCTEAVVGPQLDGKFSGGVVEAPKWPPGRSR